MSPPPPQQPESQPEPAEEEEEEKEEAKTGADPEKLNVKFVDTEAEMEKLGIYKV